MRRKYKTEAERKAAMKAYQTAYRELRKSGKWKRKNRVGSKTPPKQNTPVQRPKYTPEERKAIEKAKSHRYWHDHYSAVIKARRLAAMTPEQRERHERLAALREARQPQGIVREIIDRLAAENNQTPDETTAWCIERGAIDFLLRAIAPRMKSKHYNRDMLMRVALQAVRLFLCREAAVMEWKPGAQGPRAKRKATVEIIDVE